MMLAKFYGGNIRMMLSMLALTCLVYLSCDREMANIPLIPLGLKETKEVDFSVAFKVKTWSHLLVSGHVDQEHDA